MGFRFRKSFGKGPFRVTVSKSGVGYSVGGKGFRYTKKANGGTRTTYSIPGTGISYVEETASKKKHSKTKDENAIMDSTPEFRPDPIPETSHNTQDNAASGKTIYCSHCYKMVDASVKFCPNCGKPLSAIIDTASASSVKKPIYKRWWAWTIAIILLFGSCGSESEDTVKTNNTQNVIESEALQDASAEIVISLLEPEVSDAFENYKIYHKDKVIYIDLWEAGLTDAARLAVTGDKAAVESWSSLRDNLIGFSTGVYDYITNASPQELHISVNLLDDVSKESVLLSVLDKRIIYDIVNVVLEVESTAETENTMSTVSSIYDIESQLKELETNSDATSYVLNTDSKKFHNSTCSRVDIMDSINRDIFTGTRTEIIAQGYTPCGICNP